MNCDVRFLPTARKDINSIADYLIDYGPTVRVRFLGAVEKVFQTLQDGVVEYPLSRNPELARLGYHVALANSYLMVYYHNGNERVIAHVFHQSQDYASIVLGE